MAAALPQLRRNRAPSANIGAWYCAGQWLVSRTVGLERRKRPLRRRTCRTGAARDRIFRRLRPDRGDRRELDGRTLCSGVQRPLRRADDRCTTLFGRLVRARLLRRGLDRRAPGRARLQHADPVHRSARPSAGRASTHQDLDVPGRQDPRRFRAEPRRVGTGPGAGARWRDGHAPSRRGAGAR